MIFNNELNKVRSELDLSINKLGQFSGVSPTYISRIQNTDNLPSKKILISLVYALCSYAVSKNKDAEDYKRDLFNSYMQQYQKHNDEDSLSLNELNKDYESYVNHAEDYKKRNYENLKEKVYKNQLILKEGGYMKTTDTIDSFNQLIGKPIFDVSWLFSQKEFELLIPRNYINSNAEDDDIVYNYLTIEDKKVLHELITAYINAKYNKVNDKKEFFEHRYNEFINNDGIKVVIEF